MVEVQLQPLSPKPPAVVPMTAESPLTSQMGQRQRRRSRHTSNDSSVVSATAAEITSANEHSISNNEAMTHLIKATIGGGLLAMPEAFHNCGWLVGILGTVILGLAVLNMMATVVRCSHRLRSGKYAAAVLAEQKNVNSPAESDQDEWKSSKLRKTKDLILPPMDYPDTVAAVFKRGSRGRFARWAPFLRYFTSTGLVATYYGVNIIYVCIVAGTIKQLVDQYTVDGDENSWAQLLHGRSIRWYPAVTMLLIVPVGMVRLIKYLVPFSIAANACLVAGVSVVFYFIFAYDDGNDPLRPDERAKMVVWPVTRWSLFAGSTLCSLEGIGMLLHIENAMSRPLELVGPPAYTLHKSMIAIVVINGLLGLFGYLRYGDRCAGSVSLNLPSNNRLSEMIKVLVAFGVLLTYGLQLTVTVDLAWQRLRRWLVKSTETEEVTGNKEELTPKLTAFYYALRFSLILGTILVATAVPDIGPLVSIVGAVGFSLLGIMVPCIMETVWYWDQTEEEDEDDGESNAGQDSSGDGQATAVSLDCDCSKTPSTANSNGEVATTGVLSPEPSIATPFGKTPMMTASIKNKMSVGRRQRLIRRLIRHVKNFALFLLGVSALVGGAYYNIIEMVALAKDKPISSEA